MIKINTPLKSIFHLLYRTLKHSFFLLFVSAILMSIVLMMGIWNNNQFAADLVFFGASSKVILLTIAFAIAIPLAELIGATVRLLALSIQQLYVSLKDTSRRAHRQTTHTAHTSAPAVIIS